jgi:anti-sigma regulatory factor (Ser/Thr protein kinase)
MVNTPASKDRAGRGRGGLHGGRRPIEDAVKLSLDAGAESAGKARRAVAALRSDLDPPLVESLRLLLTELITNAVRHAGSGVDILVQVSRSAVRVEVADTGGGFDANEQISGNGSGGGWGLYLVERLADRWGVTRNGTGTTVWFELERRV